MRRLSSQLSIWRGFSSRASFLRKVPADQLRAFQNDLGDGLLGGMRERERNVNRAQPRGERGCLAVEGDGWPAAGLTRDFNVTPAYAMVPASAQRLHGRLLGREAGGVPFHPVGLGVAVANLAFGEHAMQKAFPMASQSLRDARDFRNVNAGADNHERLS